MTINHQHIEALQSFGYTERESRFLYLVATFSGYFLARHYAQFLGTTHNGTQTEFLKKVTEYHHAEEQPYARSNGKIYRLYSRNLYAVIGKEHSANRKPGPLNRATNKLLSLSFVLAHQQFDYLEEEQDKIAFFTEQQGVAKELLPAKVFKSPKSKQCTTRYFIDKHPIFTESTNQSNPRIGFVYIDDGVTTVQSFRTHLSQYEPLLRALQMPLSIVYVADLPKNFAAAERHFNAAFNHIHSLAEPERLQRYFQVRQLWEERRYKELTNDQLVERSQGEKQLTGPHYEQLYSTWKQTGKLPESVMARHNDNHNQPQFQFRTFLVPH